MRAFFISILFSLLLIGFVSPAQADSPFGIKMGEDIKNLSIWLTLENGNYRLNSVPKPDEDFLYYMAKHHDSTGICLLAAGTEPLLSSGKGENIRAEFDRIKQRLEGEYGETRTIDYVTKGTLNMWRDNFMSKMKSGEAFLGAIWTYNRGNKNLGKEIGKIALFVESKGRGEFNINLQYYMNNYNQCNRRIYSDGKKVVKKD